MCTGKQKAMCIMQLSLFFCVFAVEFSVEQWRISEDRWRNRKRIFAFFTAPACQGNLQPQLPQEVLVCPAVKRERERKKERVKRGIGRLDGWIKWKKRNIHLYQHCQLRNKTSTVHSGQPPPRQPCLLTVPFCTPPTYPSLTGSLCCSFSPLLKWYFKL